MESYQTQNGGEFGLATSSETLGVCSISSTVDLHKESSRRVRLGLIILCVLLFVVCIVLAVFLVLKTPKKDEGEKDGVTCKDAPDNIVQCGSEGCIGVAAALKQSVNESVDPCEDFFQYSCGAWIKNNPIPSSEKDISTFRKLLNHNNEKLLLILLEDDDFSNSHAAGKAKNYFKSCMNEDSSEDTAKLELKLLIKRFGLWQLGNATWNESAWDFFESLGEIQRDFSYKSPLFKLETNADPYNSSRYLLQV